MKKDENDEELRDVDSGRAWVSLVACCLGNFLIGFVTYSAGIFHITLLTEFQEGNAATAVVGSIFASLLFMGAPLVGMSINSTSCRLTMMMSGLVMTLGFSLGFIAKSLIVVLITYGVIAGFGSGLGCVPPVVAIGYGFKKYRGLANGLVTAAGGCGMFASGPLVQYFLDVYGLNGAFLMMSAVSSHVIVFGALMFPSGPEKYYKKKRNLLKAESKIKCYSIRHILDIEILKNKSFATLLSSSFLLFAAYAVIVLHLPNYAVVQDSSLFEASFLILDVGIGSALSRIVSGLVSGEESGIDPVLLMLGTLSIIGLLTLLFPFYSNFYWQQSVYAVLFGIYSGGLITFTVPVCLEIVGLSKLASAIGLLYFVGGIGFFIGPTAAGIIIDHTGRYENCFYCAGACFIASSLLVLLTTLWRPKQVDRKQQNDTQSNMVLKGSNFMAGSGLLTGSLHILFEIQRNVSNYSLSQNQDQDNIDVDRVPLNSKS